MPGDPRNRFDSWESPSIEDGELTEYNWLVHRPENLELAEFVDIGAFTVINAHEGVSIETGVQIGPHCDIHSRSTIDDTEGPIAIREGARIGSHTTILPEVTVGREATIGAHSLVKDDVPPETFVAGVPASPPDE